MPESNSQPAADPKSQASRGTTPPPPWLFGAKLNPRGTPVGREGPEEAGFRGDPGPPSGIVSCSSALAPRHSPPPVPSLAFLISHQASAGPGKTLSPKSLGPLQPLGGTLPLLPPQHPLPGPPGPPAACSPQVGAQLPCPSPLLAPNPCPSLQRGGISSGEGRGLAFRAGDARPSRESTAPGGPQAVWPSCCWGPAGAPRACGKPLGPLPPVPPSPGTAQCHPESPGSQPRPRPYSHASPPALPPAANP